MFTKEQWLVIYFATSEYSATLYGLGFDDDGKEASDTHEAVSEYMKKNKLF